MFGTPAQVTDRLRSAIAVGLRRGLHGYIWLLKILLPISLATALLDYCGWVQKLDFILQPLMQWLSLPASAALPILIGVLTGVYGCIAAMAVLPLTVAQMTIIAVFVLIAHNLPQEGMIQARSGIHFLKSTLVRLAAAVVTCTAVAWCLQPEAGEAALSSIGGLELPSFSIFLKNWSLGMLSLCLKIFFILSGIMMLIELMRAFRLMDMLVGLLAPVLKLMGLQRQVGVLWLTGILLGLSYGGAVIVQQARELQLRREEIEKLQLSIGINHSMIEDPLVFLPLGLNPIWMLVPRLLAAISVVYVADGWFRLKRMFHKKQAPVA
jgi:Fe2+ transport system protein B